MNISEFWGVENTFTFNGVSIIYEEYNLNLN